MTGPQRLVLLPAPISRPAEIALHQRFQVVRLYDPAFAQTLPAALADGIEVAAVGAAAGFPDRLWNALPKLKLIAIHGVGTDRVDLERAHARGVEVLTSPDVLSNDVADLAVALWLALSRRLLDADQYARTGQWGVSAPFPLTATASGKRAGIVGLGRIGSALARRLEPFGGEIAYTATAPKASPYRFVGSVEELAATSDVLFVTAAMQSGAAPLVGARELAALGPEGLLVNVARGAAVDEEALIQALSSSGLAGAGLDVFVDEPVIDPRFASLPNVILQPHLGSATKETRSRMAAILADQIGEFMERPT